MAGTFVPNWYLFPLDAMKSRRAELELGGVFAALQEGIVAAGRALVQYDSFGDEEISDVDDWNYETELVGSALVLSQRYMSGMLQLVSKIHSEVRKTGKEWSLPSGKELEDGFRCRYGPMAADGAIRFAAAAHGGANFFKHEPEWMGDWSNGRSSTVAAVKKLGGRQESSLKENVRRVTEGLGVHDPADLQPLLLKLDEWRTEILTAVRDELRSKGLVP